MDGQLDDQESLYECLPEMCETALSLNNQNIASSSLEEENTVSSDKENVSISEIPLNLCIRDILKNDKTSSVEKCPCNKYVQWMWDAESKSRQVYILNDKLDVRFHRRNSSGTAVVRCTEPMSKNQYWFELKMTCPVYGTDVMIGVGTSKEKLRYYDNRFVSVLGRDSQTWGYSHTGLFHHNGQRRFYAQTFDQGNTIGVHLDLWRGTLSFYKDRKHLGVASSGLKGKTLYAMVSSTAARTGMRIVHSTSFPSSLQFLCCKKLREIIPDDKNVLDVVDIPPGLKQFLSSKLSWLLDKRSAKTYFGDCCRTLEPEDVEAELTNLIDDSDDEDLDFVSTPLYPNVSSQIFLLGSMVFNSSDEDEEPFEYYNQSQRPIEYHIPEEGESAPEHDAKRRRLSFDYTASFSDYEDEL